MKAYKVTIRATVTNILVVEARNIDDACAAAHREFQKCVEITGEYERIEQEAIHIEEDEA